MSRLLSINASNHIDIPGHQGTAMDQIGETSGHKIVHLKFSKTTGDSDQFLHEC